MRISDWSSDVCSSDLVPARGNRDHRERRWGCCRSSLLAFLPRLDGRHHRLGDIDLDVQTQFLQYREQLAPLDGFATPLDLAQEVLAHTDAFRGSRSEEHTSELQSLMRISYAVFCLKKKNQNKTYDVKNKYTRRYQ